MNVKVSVYDMACLQHYAIPADIKTIILYTSKLNSIIHYFMAYQIFQIIFSFMIC